jgi:hypothetical protein
MQNTSFQTITVQPLGSTTPTTLVKSAKHPLRAVVSNVGPTLIFIAQTTTDLAPTPSTSTYRLFPGEQTVLVAAPKEGFYAVSAAVGGLLSISISEALPVVL